MPPGSVQYEIFIERAVLPGELRKIRPVPQDVGWRYMPHAHGRPVCGCPACLPKGSIKSRKLRERLEPTQPLPSLPEVKAKLLITSDPDEISNLLWALRWKRRRTDPSFLDPLFACNDASIREDLALTLPYFRHPETKRLMDRLVAHELSRR